jgi:streptomycin 3"-adenylyltransferase
LEDLREQAPPKGFEMSVVLERYCKKFVYPTPYELHFSNDCLKQYLENPLLLCNDDPKTDYDLAAHFTVITNAGVVLCGKPISEVFSDIPREEYLDSIRKDIENAREDMVDFPVNVILNLCRVYSYIRDGLVLSKAEGGQWGLINLPEKYHSLIAAMLDNYIQGTDTQSMAFCKDKTLQIDFCEYMLNLIFNPTV